MNEEQTLDRLRAALAQRYAISTELGRGGMALVFRARDLQHDRPVALKILRPEIAAALGHERFLREIRVAAGMQHPHILPLYDSGTADGVLYYVMPLVDGESLRARLDRERQLPVPEAIALAGEVAEALDYAHRRGVVHRDVKPENILLSDGHALVADFGIARAIQVAGGDQLTETGVAVGTPHYMSPEQATAEPQLDGRSDIYSLGCVLYEMLSGAPPFSGGSAQAVMARHTVDPVPPLRTVRSSVPEALEAAIRRALAKSPADRYATARQFADALAASPATGRSRRWSFVAAAVLMVGAAAVVWRLSRAPSAGPPLPPASDRTRLAVLPLANDGAPQEAYIAEGMTEELTGTLSQISGLRVLAHGAVRRYVGAPAAPADVGRELGVGAVVEGGARREGDRLHLHLELVDTRTQENLWSERYDEPLRDVAAVQRDVARRVADKLKVRLLTAEQAQLSRYAPSNAVAFDLYLRGLYEISQGTRAANDSAITLLERETATDPNIAAGYSALAHAYINRLFSWDADKRWEERAYVAIQKALALDPSLADAYLARADLTWTLANHFPHARAIQDIKRAITLNPSFQAAHQDLGGTYMHIGLLDKALQELRVAVSLDPNDPGAPPRIARTHWYAQQFDTALAEFERIAGWEPEHALVLDHLGRTVEALRLLDQPNRGRGQGADAEDFASARAVILARGGRRTAAEQDIRLAVRLGSGRSHFHHAEYNIATAYALLGDHAKAIEWLRRAAGDGLPCYPLFARDPYLDGLRRDSAFVAFLAQLKAQWEGYKATL